MIKGDSIFMNLANHDVSTLKNIRNLLNNVKYVNVKICDENKDKNQEVLSYINDYLTCHWPFKISTEVPSILSQNIIYENKFHKAHIFQDIDLTYEEQTYIRDKPKEYLLHTINLFKKYTNAKTILEIGSIRSKMTHSISDFNPACCNDGHSTYFWKYYTNADIYTVDIDNNCKNIIETDKRLSGVNACTQDAIEYAKKSDKKIDLLFLDAWDVVHGSPYAEKHLEIYKLLKNKLSNNCLILIDDTDVGNGGKGKLVIPQLLEDNFIQLTNKRQSLFLKQI